MERLRIFIGLLSNLLVAVLVKSDCITYENNGKLETTCNPTEPTSPSKMVANTNDSIPSCFKVKLIIYYDNFFRDSDLTDPEVRVEELMDMTQNGNFGVSPYFSGLGIDIKLDIVAVDHYDGVISDIVSDKNTLQSTIADPDTRNADIWFFLTTNDGSGGTIGISGQNDPCGDKKQVGVFRTNIDLSTAQMLATHIGLLLAQNKPFADYYNENQPWCLETCCDNCTNFKCSEIVDINQNPYQCLSEKEAANWHKKCLPANISLCDYTGAYEDCEWTDWLDRDNPSGNGDYEFAPDGCEIQKYEVQLVSGGEVYSDVAALDQCLLDSPYVHCVNKDGCQCDDYRVKYCCGPPRPKCYCCPPRLPINNCTDNGCMWNWNQLGECVDITNPDWNELNTIYDLSAKANMMLASRQDYQYPGLCGASLDKSCCRCMKKKTCMDTGCEQRFKGKGVCIDAVDGDLSKYDIDFEVKPDQTPGLCTNNVNDNCCSCFKKQDYDSGCYKMRCFVGKVEGICVGPNDLYPYGYKETDQRCEEKGNCRCFIPCKDIWKKRKCKKYAKKGKCTEATTAANCCATCKNY